MRSALTQDSKLNYDNEAQLRQMSKILQYMC